MNVGCDDCNHDGRTSPGSAIAMERGEASAVRMSARNVKQNLSNRHALAWVSCHHSTGMVDSVTGLRCAERSRAPDHVTDGHGCPMQTVGCTWRQVVPVGEDPAAHGHWGTFTDLYDAMPCHAALHWCERSRDPDRINMGFLGRWGTHACPQCLPSDVVPVRSWTWTLRRPGIRLVLSARS